ncbi:uncharacterized protein At2g29880-like [Zingiber officinale]|uniref:uncharacterized protein At2g29880-like n=1 Tax=Zingiber officinale TaxID=94328 RepID=UPI001C4B9DC7|nr:uncharacterized protein At2g29880-like [Zingiber officinale]
MVDAAMRGWRDRNGVLNKRTVEIKILPTLNATLECEKTFAHSEFGWDSMIKKFTASDEIWEDYFKSHPKHEHYWTDTFEDYEDLRLVVGNGTTTRKYAIGLGDDTNARTIETEENGGTNLLDDYVFDHNSGEFIQSNRQESSYQPLFPEDLASPLPSQPMSSEVPQATRKRDRTEFEAKSSTSKNIDPDVLNRLCYTIEKTSSKIELVGVADDNCWDAIKEVLNLDNHTSYKALDWLNTRAKKVTFLKMTIEERLEWIDFKMSE